MRTPDSTDLTEQRAWAAEFTARYGMAPIAGGETPPAGSPPAAAPQPQPQQAPPAQPQPAMPQPQPGIPQAQPQPQPQFQPQANGGQPQPQAQPQPAGQPQQPAEAPPQGDQLAELMSRMDELQQRVSPPQVDPLAVELGLVPEPPQGPQPAGQPQPQQPFSGQPQQPGAQRQQQFDPAQQPGQPGEGGPRTEAELIQEYIDERAREQAMAAVQPFMKSQESQRRREEALGLREDYPEFNDRQFAESRLATTRRYAEGLGFPQLAQEPGFIEIVHLAQRAIESATPAQPGQQPGQAAPAQPGQPQQPQAFGAPAFPGAPQNGAVTLETPGGAPPPAPQNDRAQAILAAGGGGLSPLWGGRSAQPQPQVA